MKRRTWFAPGLTIFFGVFPLLFLVLLSVAQDWHYEAVFPAGVTLRRWADLLLGNEGVSTSLVRSLILGLLVATVTTALGFVTSKFVAESRHRQLWLVFAYFPFAISPVVLGVYLLYFYIRAGISGTEFGVFLGHTTLSYGFAVVFLSGNWNEHKRGLADVARTLGASPWWVWTRVLLPASVPLLTVCFFQSFLLSWSQYGITLLLGAGKIRTLPLEVFDFVFEADLAYAAVAGLSLVLPPLVVLWFKRRVLLAMI